MSVETEILGPMSAIYSPPFGSDDPAAVMEQYGRALAGFPDDVLRSAWTDIVKEHERQAYPSIATIRKACLQHMPKGANSPKESVISGEYCFDSEAGQLALSERCGQDFLLACQRYKRVLSIYEVHRMAEDNNLRRQKMKSSDDPVDREVYRRSRQTINEAENALDEKYGK